MNDLEVAFAVNQAAPTFTCLSVLSEHRYVIDVKGTTFDQMRMTMAASKHGSRCYPGFSLIISCLVLLMCQRSYLSPRICADLRWDAAEALTLGFIEDMLSTRSYSTQRTTRRRTFTLVRIPHNTGATCSFQLHLRSGDLHPNPGSLTNRRSVKFPCGECQISLRGMSAKCTK